MKGIQILILNSNFPALFRIPFLLFLFLITSASVFAQFEPDTLEDELDEVVVFGYQTNQNILETAASIGLVTVSTVNGMSPQNLVYGMNTIAGVRMEERATGSYRISVRGSSLRSPFGIRNVKVYWNDIPFTEPSGTTFLNLLDLTNMQSVEVLKGPAGSLYGAGNGGVVRIQSTAPYFEDNLETGLSIGSFGLMKYQLGYHEKLENGHFSLKYADQSTDGYRDQNFLDRKVLELSGSVDYSPTRTLKAHLLYSDLYYGIPGGLNADQFAANPSQARPGNPFVLGSVDANASVDQQAVLFAITHEMEITPEISNKSSVFGTFSAFDNPFNLDYKIDSRTSGGVRSSFDFDTRLGATETRLSAGIEYQASNYASRNYTNDSSRVGDLNFDDELAVQASTTFLSAQFTLPGDWIINTGISLNTVHYQIHRFETFLDGDTTGLTRITFDPQLIPRLNMAKRITPTITLHTGIGYGFSPPTIEEVRTNEGSINLNLQPEVGANLEAGLRGYLLKGRLAFDVTSFYYRLKDSIVQQQSDRGTVLFRNAGSTKQVGIEINTSVLLVEDYDAPLEQLRWNTAYTWNHFRFDEYLTVDGDFSGNELTGVAPNVLVSSLFAQSKPGLYGTVSFTYNDRIPLEDDNSVYSEAYKLVQLKTGWKGAIINKLTADVSFGIDNLLDERYSRGFDINAFGGRYYQPAPERNWFFTTKLKYHFGK